MDRLTAMEIFIRVVETGSFSEAARQMQIGYPAVSKIVAQLERRLGVKLLSRSTRGLMPTEAGESFFERARQTLQLADEAEVVARGAATGFSGRLRVSAAVTFASQHIIPHLPAFMAEHPLLDLEVILDDRQIDLIEEGIDVALRMGTLADSALTARRLSRARQLVIGTPAYIERRGEPRSPSELPLHDSIVYAKGAGRDVWTFRKGLAELTVTVKGRLRVSAAEGVRAAVMADLGLAVASEWMFTNELASGKVKAVLTDWELAPIDLWAIFPMGRVASAKARAFVAFVEEKLASPEPHPLDLMDAPSGINSNLE